MPYTCVRQIPEHYQFVNTDTEVDSIKSQLPTFAWDFGRQFDSFFVWVRDGELVSVYGLHGTVPYLDAFTYKVV